MDTDILEQIKSLGAINSSLFSSALTDNIKHALESSQKVVESYNSTIKNAVEQIQAHMKIIAERIKVAVASIIQPFTLFQSWNPLIYVSQPTGWDKRKADYLSVDTDQYGYFVFGGITVFKLHSRTSRCGRYLHRLLLSVSEEVTYEEIQQYIGSGDRTKAFKDLKYRLKQEGYTLDYELIRTEGIALKGIVAA